jgi:predicted alpha/beta-hydrolase family hydrolase
MRTQVTTPGGPAAVELDRPAASARALLVLTHGAGGGVETADLRAIRDAAVASGIAVARVTQAYRLAGRSSPTAPERQDASWLAVLATLRRRKGLAGVPLVVGGRSNGARVACRTAVASGAVAVVALAFPLHPPGRPDTSRLPELDSAGVPVLVVQGDRDPFGMPSAGPGREVVVIAGADHGLRRGLPNITAAVVDFVDGQVATAG